VDEKHTYSKEYLLSSLCVLLGGRAAEELTLNTQTTGAENDLERATEIARRMVCEYGMSDSLGPVTFGKREEQIFLGKEIARHKDYSELTAQKIDEEIRRIVIDAYDKTCKILKENIEKLNKLANALLEKETLNSQEIDEILFTKEAQAT
jgi:cell division protease FtsH